MTWQRAPTTGGGFADYQAQQNLLMARSFVAGPAIGLIVLSILGIIACIILLTLTAMGIALLDAVMELEGPSSEAARSLAELVYNFVVLIFSLAMSILTLIGSIQMKELRSYAWAMTAAILSVIPCTSPCCFLIGTPIGIWALVVLNEPVVRAAFGSDMRVKTLGR
jgi:hypothetical protein